MLKRIISLLLFLTMSQSAFARSNPPCDNEEPGTAEAIIEKVQENCPNLNELVHICDLVRSKAEEVELKYKKNRYAYQSKFQDAACVIQGEDPETIKRKIQVLWNKFGSQLICNSVEFTVSNGSLLKYGVARKNDAFIQDIANWSINLNTPDKSDGLTVLDYVKKELDDSPGPTSEKKLQKYYKILRNAGAKHKSEL